MTVDWDPGVAERNRSLIVQGGEDSGLSDQSADNFATAIQVGDDNSSIITQDNDNNVVEKKYLSLNFRS